MALCYKYLIVTCNFFPVNHTLGCNDGIPPNHGQAHSRRV